MTPDQQAEGAPCSRTGGASGSERRAGPPVRFRTLGTPGGSVTKIYASEGLDKQVPWCVD